MNRNTRQLHDWGQSIWLDNLDRELLQSGKLAHYISEDAVTGLTSNPTILSRAIAGSDQYDGSIEVLAAAGLHGEELLFELVMEDLSEAADLFRPAHDASAGLDGWVSLEVSPLLSGNTAHTIRAASSLWQKAAKANLFIKIPGNHEGLAAVEEALVDGVPVNVTLLFSPDQYRGAAQAYMRAIERRLEAGLSPLVASVASVFVSRWDMASNPLLTLPFRNRLGILMAQQIFQAHAEMLDTPRWKALASAGARPQRLLWASTGVKQEGVRDTCYVEGLMASGTIITLPEKTLLAFAGHGTMGRPLSAVAGDTEVLLAAFRKQGINPEEWAPRLQKEGIEAFAQAWHSLLALVAEKAGHLQTGAISTEQDRSPHPS